MQCVYIQGEASEDSDIQVPLTSAAVVFVLRYCQTDLFHVSFVQPASDIKQRQNETGCNQKMKTTVADGFEKVPLIKSQTINTEDTVTDGFEKVPLIKSQTINTEDATVDELVRTPLCSVSGVSHSFIKEEELPDAVKNCALPVVQGYGSYLIRCGLCCCVRHIIKESHRKSPSLHLQELLGFRAGSLKACAEVSGWTKLCEVELPHTLTGLMKTWRSEGETLSVTIPEDVMKLELHFEKPPPLHNDDKVKRAIVKDIQARKDNLCITNKDHGTIIQEFFKKRKEQKPHGTVQYRVISKTERDQRKFDVSENDSVCKFGCTEEKLVKWCAKCNDREKLRQKEKQIEMNMARLNISDKNRNDSANNARNSDNIEPIGIASLEELRGYIDEFTLNEIEYDHLYAEGVALTVADLMLYTYMYHFLTSKPHFCTQLLKHLPHVRKWLQHLITLPRIQITSSQCGFIMADLEQCLRCDDLSDSDRVMFSIPEVSLDVEEDENEISRRSRGKHKALKKELSRVLTITQETNLVPSVGSHPRGCNIHVDWNSVPLAAHPKEELPEKRVNKKCEQLENLATAVESLARPGDVIVDFCSGGGHLGIIIAYLLPQCKVYLVENKEESLLRAKQRVDKLNMTNVTLYQCNMGYFKGDFDIGVCLHACGVATDMVLQQCIQRKAGFVICPCCYGSIRNTHLITYPRSQSYKETALTDKDVIILGHAADQTEFDAPLLSQGRHCMNLVDTDRALVAREHGYQVTLCSLQPLTCTPKNNLLIGKLPV